MTSSVEPAQAIVLGIIQGLTEFLPISSSGHLVVFQRILGLKNPELLFDIIVHGGTLGAVLLVYARDLWAMGVETALALRQVRGTEDLRRAWRTYPHLRLAFFLSVGTIPAAVAGVLFEEYLEEAFGSIPSVGCMLLVTGTVLFATRPRQGPGKDLEGLSILPALTIGLAQSFALLPGISRSGVTIATGLFCGLDRDLSARFSFLLSVPAILGANLLGVFRAGTDLQAAEALPLLVGGSTALLSGYLALRLLLHLVHRGALFRFGYYCWAAGAGLLILWHLGALPGPGP